MAQKTAMELLFEEFKVLSENMRQAGDETYANTIDFLCERKEASMAKEKEQIIDACNANLKGLLINGKDYYDLNFNHHIESEPNSYTNFTPHEANSKAEYNDSLTNFTPNN
jgi:hypothetical protein